MNTASRREEIFAAYGDALSAWRSGHLDDARNLALGIRKSVEKFPKLTLLEAFIARDKGEYLTELRILEGFLREIDEARDREIAAEAWSMIGSALHALSQPKEAAAAFSKAADIEPDIVKRRIEAGNAIFAASGAADFGSEDFRGLYLRYEKLLAPIAPLPRKIFHHSRLRIGYLSADFCGHPVGRLVLPLVERRDASRFEAYCYSASGGGDEVTDRFRAAADAWRDISRLSDEDAANLIRSDEIDILFDLGVHTKGNRLPVLAYRPAAAQISGIGDVRSSGISAVDWFLSDIWCAGDEASRSKDFSERVILLPHTHFCVEPPKSLPPVAPPPCLARGFVTFGSFNNAAKITDETLALWGEILRRTPKSRLLLKHKLFGSEEGRDFTLERMANLGFDLSRVELQDFSGDYLAGKLKQYKVELSGDTIWKGTYTGGLSATAWSNLETDAGDLGIASTDKGLIMRLY